MPNPAEVATLSVAGHQFENFESVWVQIRWAESNPLFRFTTADIVEVPGEPPPANWQLLQFKPGDECTILLGGLHAITGVITVRQTAYDKDNKGVMLQGVGLTWYAARASVMHKTGNFDDKTFQQVATEVLAPTGISAKVIGALDPTPFKRLQVEPGETIWNFLERIARPRGVILGSDEDGNMLLIGDHVNPLRGELVEGWNILRCNATISVEGIYTEYPMRGQTAASDDQHGAQASEQEASAPGTAKRYSPLLTVAEQPVWGIGELVARAENEAVWHQGTEIHATIVVQGWRNPKTNDLWRAGSVVWVASPMAMLNLAMVIATVTYTQDRNAGTLTTLDLAVPWLLKDHGDWNLNNPTVPTSPAGTGSANSGPPTTPPPFERKD